MSQPSPDPNGRTVNQYHLILFQSLGSSIHRLLVRDIQEQLDAKVNTDPATNEIDLWIESPGGDAHAAYKLILDLRNRCKVLRAIVPDYAKSAATLMMLGVDEIYMAPAAELGPLDAQTEHPEKERTILSALDISDSLESLGRTSLLLAYEFTDFYEDALDLPRAVALRSVLDFMAQFMQPAIAKLDPHRIHQATNLLEVASDYGKRMLVNRNLPEDKKLSYQEIMRLVEKMVREYSAHEFIISRDEASGMLGLPVRPAESHPRWPMIREIHAEFRMSRRSLVKLMLDAELDTEPDEEGEDHEDKNPNRGITEPPPDVSQKAE